MLLSHLSQLCLRVNWEKSKLSPMQRISFLGMELDLVNHAGTRSVGVELLKYVQEQDGGPTETVSEAPGVYGDGGHAAGAAPYETASTLAPWPSPEMGVGGSAACSGSESHGPATKPSTHDQISRFSGRSAPGTDMLCFARMAPPASNSSIRGILS